MTDEVVMNTNVEEQPKPTEPIVPTSPPESTPVEEKDQPANLTPSTTPTTTSIYTKTLNLDDFTEDCKAYVIDYMCPLCKGVYYNPVIDICGHIFCQRCFEIFHSANQITNELRCPISGVTLPGVPSQITLISNILDKQTLNCCNRNIGCEWKGLVKDFVSHIENDCPKQTLQCSLQGCSSRILRENMKEHLMNCEYRIVNCGFCNISLAFNQLEEHYKSCPKYLLQCPQSCGSMIERDKMDEHVAVLCPNTVVTCKYSIIGCNEKFLNKETEEHIRKFSDTHFEMISTIVSTLKKENEEFKAQIKDLYHKLEVNPVNPLVKMCSRWNIENTSENVSGINFTGSKRPRDSEVISLIDSSRKKELNSGGKGVEVISPPTFGNTNSLKGINLFDTTALPPGVTIMDNIVKYTCSSKTEHRFVFSKIEIGKCLPTRWKIEIIETQSWIGFGVCDKKKVLTNKMKFFSSSKLFNHGTFLFSSNNYLWNCNVERENNCYMAMPKFEKGTEILFTYFPDRHELLFEIGTFSVSLTDVRPIMGTELTVCIVFLHSGNMIRLTPLNERSD